MLAMSLPAIRLSDAQLIRLLWIERDAEALRMLAATIRGRPGWSSEAASALGKANFLQREADEIRRKLGIADGEDYSI